MPERLVELTNEKGRRTYINPRHVETVEATGGRVGHTTALIRFRSGRELVVQGNKTEVAHEISGVVEIEDGYIPLADVQSTEEARGPKGPPASR